MAFFSQGCLLEVVWDLFPWPGAEGGRCTGHGARPGVSVLPAGRAVWWKLSVLCELVL